MNVGVGGGRLWALLPLGRSFLPKRHPCCALEHLTTDAAKTPLACSWPPPAIMAKGAMRIGPFISPLPLIFFAGAPFLVTLVTLVTRTCGPATRQTLTSAIKFRLSSSPHSMNPP